MESNNKEQNEMIESNQTNGSSESSTGLEENVAGLLCYLATFVTGIIFLIIEKKSHFVRFHAMQSTILFISIVVIRFVVDYVPYIWWLLNGIISLIGVILWVVLMIKAYQKEYFKVPIVGQIAEDFVNKQKTGA